MGDNDKKFKDAFYILEHFILIELYFQVTDCVFYNSKPLITTYRCSYSCFMFDGSPEGICKDEDGKFVQ